MDNKAVAELVEEATAKAVKLGTKVALLWKPEDYSNEEAIDMVKTLMSHIDKDGYIVANGRLWLFGAVRSGYLSLMMVDRRPIVKRHAETIVTHQQKYTLAELKQMQVDVIHRMGHKLVGEE